MGDEHDEILTLAESFCDEVFSEEDEDFVMKSFTPEESEKIKGALEILNLYTENYPDDVLEALRTLARLAVKDVEDADQDDSDDDDEDKDDDGKIKKKGQKWSFSFGVLDEDGDPIGFEKGSDEIALIEEIAENYEVLKDLFSTSVLLGREYARSLKNEKISEKIEALNATIEKIAEVQGLKKFGGNDKENLWGFSLVKNLDPEDD